MKAFLSVERSMILIIPGGNSPVTKTKNSRRRHDPMCPRRLLFSYSFSLIALQERMTVSFGTL